MNERLKTLLILIAFPTLAATLLLASGYAFYYDLEPDNRQRFAALLASRRQLLAEMGVLNLAIIGVAFALIWQRHVKASLHIEEGIRIMLNANPGHRLKPAGPSELQRLAQAVNALATQSEALAHDLEMRITEAKTSVEEEKNRLAALMSELSQGVLVCNLDGRILLYNERARQVICAAPSSQSGCAAPLIGLGRSIFAVVDRSLLAHALESIQAQLQKSNAAAPDAQFLITTRAGQLVRVHMAPVLAAIQPVSDRAPTISGLVLMLENITHAFERDTARASLLQSFTEGSRAAIGNIRAAAETLASYPDGNHRDQFLQVISEEACRLSIRIDRIAAEHADSLQTAWPLEEILGADLMTAAQRRMESRLGLHIQAQAPDNALWLKVDSYALLQALGYLAGRLQDRYGVREINLHLARRGRIAEFDLSWSSPTLSPQTWGDWEQDALRAGGEDSPLTLGEVMERHGAEIVYMVDPAELRPRFRLLLPIVQPPPAAPGVALRYGESRPEFYDFDLFQQAGQTPELDHVPLTDLNYTVFDTETTGLDPSAGDEIISIGAVRIVNNRLLRYETYEQLVDPRQPIAALSQAIHGISHEMLRGQPTIDEALPQFHEYCADAVLVGHNAAFDLRFLQLKETRTGVRFTQPVLDTLLLSQVLHPHQESHTLEAIAGRLGVTVVARHTALGDALATGEVFLRMIPLLAAHGVRTLGDAREAAKRIYDKEY